MKRVDSTAKHGPVEDAPRKPGRQITSPDGVVRECVLRVRMSTAEWHELQRRAEAAGKDISGYVRSRTIGAMKGISK